VILLFWIIAFFVMAVPWVRYHNKWQDDYMRLTGAEQQTSFRAFIQKPVEDRDLERRRRIGSYTGYALIAWGVIGFVIPPG
jgi:hypothetical protein